MRDLLDGLVARRLTGEAEIVPQGYADGMSAFVNILLDLDEVFGLGVEDTGEHLYWPLPALELAVVIHFEGGGYLMVRPWCGRWRECMPGALVGEGELREGRPIGRWKYSRPGGVSYEYDYTIQF
ncbi:hypothetical protein [Kribbella ginsengisoli]